MKAVQQRYTLFPKFAALVLGGSLTLAACGETGANPQWIRAGAAEAPRTDASDEDGAAAPQADGEDTACRAVAVSLRNLYYAHYEKMADGKDVRYRGDLARKMAKLLGIALKESSGNSACVTDMRGRGSSTSDQTFFRENRGVSAAGQLKISLEGRTKLLGLDGVSINSQTNYGLLQMSADRLMNAPNREIYRTFKSVILRSASQGAAYCGSDHVIRGGSGAIQSALTEAASCTEGYGSTAGVKCFAKLVTICPALNLQLGLNAPASYFATRRAAPKCAAAFTFLARSM